MRLDKLLEQKGKEKIVKAKPKQTRNYKKKLDRKRIRQYIDEGIDDMEIAQRMGCRPQTIMIIRTLEFRIMKKREFSHLAVADNKARKLLARTLRTLYEKYKFSRGELEKITGLTNFTIMRLLSEAREDKEKEGVEE